MMFHFLKSGDLVTTTQMMSFPRIGYKRQYSFYLVLSGYSLVGSSHHTVGKQADRDYSAVNVGQFFIEKEQRLRRQNQEPRR